MSFRDNNKVDYDYWKSLSDEDCQQIQLAEEINQ